MFFENFLRGRRHSPLVHDDAAALEAAAGAPRTMGVRTTLAHAGETVVTSTYILSGLMGRYMVDHNGERQLIALHMPGDFVDLHGYLLKRLDHDIATLTACEIVTVAHDRLDILLPRRPALTRLLWFSTILDAAMHRQWVFRLGRLDALSRVGHFLCETEIRLRAVQLSDGRSFPLLMTQIDLAEATGLTPVHVNRMLRELRSRGLVEMQGGRVTMHDLAALCDLCQFNPAYLLLDEASAIPASPVAKTSSLPSAIHHQE